MRIKELRIKNFLSFGEDFKIEFPDGNGFTLVEGSRGENCSNGVGKSSLFEAVFWCLFGQTVRDIKASGIIRVGTAGAEVEVTFDNGLVVTRKYSSKEKKVFICWNGRKETFHTAQEGSNRVLEILGVDAALFENCCFFGRSFKSFSSLGGSAKGKFISVFANSDFWDKALAGVGSSLVSMRRQFEGLKISKTSLEDTIGRTKEQLVSLDSQLADLKAGLLEKRNALQVRLAEAEKNVVMFQDAKTSLGILPNVDSLVAVREGLKKELGLIHEQLGVSASKVREVDSQVSGWQNEKQSSDSKLAQLQSLLEGTCPVCGGVVDAAGADKYRQEIEVLKKARYVDGSCVLEGSIAEAIKIKDVEFINKERLENLHKETSEKLDKASVDVDAFNGTLAKHSKADADIVRAVNDKEQVVIALSSLDNSGECDSLVKVIEISRVRLGEEQVAIDNCNNELVRVESDLADCNFWQKGFKVLRQQAFDSVIGFLNARVSVCCKAFGLVFDKLYFEASEPTGSSTKEVVVELVLVRGEQKLSFGNMSEGEKARVDIAIFLSVRELVHSVKGKEFGLCVMDEPLGALDEQGKRSLFEFFSNLEAQIFIIDHDSHFKDSFGSVISLVKENGCTRLAS